MPHVAPIPWQQFECFLLYVGCTFVRQKGDHRIYWREGFKRPIVLPAKHDLPVFVIKSNLRTLGMSTEEYLMILERL